MPPTQEELKEKFETAVEQLQELEMQKAPTRYISGVVQALGWACGEYTDDPLDI
jgi:hypothetical protein